MLPISALAALGLFQSHVSPPLTMPKHVEIVDSCIALAATLISHQQHQGTHPFSFDSSVCSIPYTHLLFSHLFIRSPMYFHCVRPLLYKGHSLESFWGNHSSTFIRIQVIQLSFEVFSQSVCANLVLYLESWQTQVVF